LFIPSESLVSSPSTIDAFFSFFLSMFPPLSYALSEVSAPSRTQYSWAFAFIKALLEAHVLRHFACLPKVFSPRRCACSPFAQVAQVDADVMQRAADLAPPPFSPELGSPPFQKAAGGFLYPSRSSLLPPYRSFSPVDLRLRLPCA